MRTEAPSTSDKALDAALALDGVDYEFFFGLFDDEPSSSDNGDTTTTGSDSSSHTTASSSQLVNSQRSNRRRKRWHQVAPDKTNLSVVVRLDLSSNDHGQSAREALASAWEEIAKSQKRERHAAEKENAALREMLKSQTLAAERMFKLTQKAGALAAPALPPIATIESYLGPVMAIEQINDELDLVALEADVVLASGAFASAQLEFREINFRLVNTETGDAIQLELDTAWVLPFPLEQVVQAAMLQLARTTPKEKIYSIHEVHKDADLIVTQAVAGPKEDDGKAGVIHTQIATRRLPTASDGSIVLVMKTYGRFFAGGTTWVGSSNGEGYIRVSSVSTSTTPLSRVEFCRRTRAHPPSDANLSPAEHSKWIDLAINGPMRGSSERVDKVVQALENLLLTPSEKEI
jgi:hypothetical protein